MAYINGKKILKKVINKVTAYKHGVMIELRNDTYDWVINFDLYSYNKKEINNMDDLISCMGNKYYRMSCICDNTYSIGYGLISVEGNGIVINGYYNGGVLSIKSTDYTVTTIQDRVTALPTNE